MNKNDYVYRARVLRVIDGDTVLAELDLGFHMMSTLPVRLAHINARERNEEGGKEATDYLKGRIEGKEVVMRTYKPFDKYGRYLAIVYDGETNINEEMVEKGLAVPYGGEGA